MVLQIDAKKLEKISGNHMLIVEEKELIKIYSAG